MPKYILYRCMEHEGWLWHPEALYIYTYDSSKPRVVMSSLGFLFGVYIAAFLMGIGFWGILRHNSNDGFGG